MEKFIKFLEDNNAWENFERAFNEYNKEVKGYKNRCKEDPKAALAGAFKWSGTREGHDYWNELNDKWMQEITPLKEKLLSDD